jgi:hypothetical protein
VGGFLREKKRLGLISSFIPGEKFTPFDPAGRAAVEKFPSLARDSDYGRGNPGVTIVLF